MNILVQWLKNHLRALLILALCLSSTALMCVSFVIFKAIFLDIAINKYILGVIILFSTVILLVGLYFKIDKNRIFSVIGLTITLLPIFLNEAVQISEKMQSTDLASKINCEIANAIDKKVIKEKSSNTIRGKFIVNLYQLNYYVLRTQTNDKNADELISASLSMEGANFLADEINTLTRNEKPIPENILKSLEDDVRVIRTYLKCI